MVKMLSWCFCIFIRHNGNNDQQQVNTAKEYEMKPMVVNSNDLMMLMKCDFKILLIGSKSSGKTSLMNRFLGRSFDPRTKPTMGFNLMTLDLNNEHDHLINVEVWDTAGTPGSSKSSNHHQLTNSQFYYQNVDLVIAVFDISDLTGNSFEDCVSVVKDYLHYEQSNHKLNSKKKKNQQNDSKIMFVGNKVDLIEDGECSNDASLGESSWDQSTMAVIADYVDRIDSSLYQTSARTMQGTKQLFNDVTKLILDTYSQKQLLATQSPPPNSKCLDNYDNISESSTQTWCMVSVDLSTKNLKPNKFAIQDDIGNDPFNGQLSKHSTQSNNTRKNTKSKPILSIRMLLRKIFCLL